MICFRQISNENNIFLSRFYLGYQHIPYVAPIHPVICFCDIPFTNKCYSLQTSYMFWSLASYFAHIKPKNKPKKKPHTNDKGLMVRDVRDSMGVKLFKSKNFSESFQGIILLK